MNSSWINKNTRWKKLQAELRLRESEEIREALGSDYDSDGDCDDDVTGPKELSPRNVFPLESEQNELIKKVLQQITDNPTVGEKGNTVNNWLCDSVKDDPITAGCAADSSLRNGQHKRVPLPKNLLSSVPRLGDDSFDGCGCGYIHPATDFRKKAIFGSFFRQIPLRQAD